MHRLEMMNRLGKTLQHTPFAHSPIVAVAANVGSADMYASETPGMAKTLHLDSLLETLASQLSQPTREHISSPFLCEIDHCFAIKGSGTVMTGTILKGTVQVGDTIEIPSLKIEKKIKSIQSFKHRVHKASQGDRVGLCVQQLDPSSIQRGVIAAPHSVHVAVAIMVDVHKVGYYKYACQSRSKFHVTIGHETTMAQVVFFKQTDSQNINIQEPLEYLPSMTPNDTDPVIALLQFEKPLVCPWQSIYIASKLDADPSLNQCRIAFYGHAKHLFVSSLSTPVSYCTSIKDVEPIKILSIFKWKERVGEIERVIDARQCICKNMFKKETRIDVFVGKNVVLPALGLVGKIEGRFGQSGKFRVTFSQDVPLDFVNKVNDSKRGETRDELVIRLKYKKLQTGDTTLIVQ